MNKRSLWTSIVLVIIIAVFLIWKSNHFQSNIQNLKESLSEKTGATSGKSNNTHGLTSSSTLTIFDRNFVAYHPDSFQLEYLNSRLKNPRILYFHNERLFIGSKSGIIYWMDPPYTKTNSIAKLSKYPHSLVIRDKKIFVARTDGIYWANYEESSKWIAEDDFDLFVSLPGGNGHNSRTLKIGPDKRMHVSIGIRGNCSDEYLHPNYPEEKRRGGIYVVDESGNQPALKPYASGLRNPVGFDWHPATNEMYASNNGPDHLGFELPPEYFTKVPENSFHGMPWFQYDGESLIRDDCIESAPPISAGNIKTPEILLPARNAPMDVAFIPDHAKAKNLIGHAIVALRGSWGTAGDGSAGGDKASRRPPSLALIEFKDGVATQLNYLLTGFQSKNSGNRWARPVGVAVGPDGEIYFTSDEGAQGLYRLKKI